MEKTKEISGETCRKCGKARNSPDDLYCSKCGNLLNYNPLIEEIEIVFGINIYLPSPKPQKLVPWLKLREANQDLKLKISNAKYSSCDKCDVLCNLLGL